MITSPPEFPAERLPDLILAGYREALFPMADAATGQLDWYTAEPRAVMSLTDYHVPRRVLRLMNQPWVRFTHDVAFEEVIRACSDRSQTWISEELIRAYCELHRRGMAHSVEVWRGAQLVGGLYGVHLGAAFFGESMFHRVDNGAKLAFAHLLAHLRDRQFLLLDIQEVTALTAQFHPTIISEEAYDERLRTALAGSSDW